VAPATIDRSSNDQIVQALIAMERRLGARLDSIVAQLKGTAERIENLEAFVYSPPCD
jgi:hypothetical protein